MILSKCLDIINANNRNEKTTILLITFLAYVILIHAQWDRGGSIDYDDDEAWTLQRVGFDIAAGAVLAVVGYLLMQIKSISGLGKFLVGVGAFLGIGSIIIYLFQIIGMILSATLSFAIKAGIVIGAILLVLWILKGIYEWLTK